MIFALYLNIYIYFLIKKQSFCDNLANLLTLNSNICISYEYSNLPTSDIFSILNKTLNTSHKQLYFEKLIYKEKSYLFALSKFIDYKINSQKSKFRAKNNMIIIDNFAYVLAKSIYKQKPYIIFKTYKKYYLALNIKQKENKIFKILLAQKLLHELVHIERELVHISKIIQINKKRKFNFNYNKNIYNYAKYYSFFKYNVNSTYFVYKNKLNKANILNNFISELYNAEHKIKIIITYLKTMF